MRRPILCLCFSLSMAVATAPARADWASCLAGLQKSAAAAGVNQATIDSATNNLEANDAASFIGQQPEFSTPIWDYMAALVDEERVTEGRDMLRKWAQALSVAQARFGVDPATLVAIWGVESDYGKGFGWRPVVQSLATLSCTPNRRQDNFRGEFIAALKILANGDVKPAEFTGSWAGAFGHTQFMPTTFLRNGVDLDGDGHRDIVGSVPDALGTTANYLRKSGWDASQPWGFEVRVPKDYSGPSGRTSRQPMSAWSGRGITRVDGAPLGSGNAALIIPAGNDGPAFLVTRNFDALYTYNNAISYALAIAVLSDRLRGGKGIVTPWPTDDPGLSRIERRELQTLLQRRGYTIGNIDGVLGTKTREAIADFEEKAGMKRDGRAGVKVLEALRGR
ncbi:MAG: lytic murein transglycosylase [Beijerinckiaceae bacterium]